MSGMRDFTCGSCGKTFGSNCRPGDIQCPECEARPSSREDDWLATHRFSLDAAVALAREHAPKVRVNGLTALDVLARYTARLAAQPATGSFPAAVRQGNAAAAGKPGEGEA